MNSYIFIRVVGKGSYGEVNLVKHKTDRKQYVIKKLNLSTSSKRERRSAEQEAQLLSQLRHPNIVTYRESWEGDDRQLYIVMGFCEGGDLYHRLKQRKGELLPERQVVEWFVQIAMALQYLHERNILHRDLKTQNIFLTKTNIIKVGDLGIARVLENQNDMASTLIGTPYYMSPELFSNKPYNHKSDVWALGCCVYEMSTLKHAFNAKDMNSLVYRIVEGKLPQMPSRYDPQLGDLIKSMLSKKPEERPDVKLILRQPYIKRQIAMFLEATKEKTAKSRQKGVGDVADSTSNTGTPCEAKPERLSASPEPRDRTKGKEGKSQQQKIQGDGADILPPRTPPPPKPSSPDALKASVVSMATVSNISVDVPLQPDDGATRRQVSQSVMSHPLPSNEGDMVHKDGKRRGKLDPKPPPAPAKPHLKAALGAHSRTAASAGLEENQPQFKLYANDTFSIFGEKQRSGMDHKDDTMELLKEADMHRPKLENVVNMDNRNDTFTLIKQSSVPSTDVQDKLEATEKLLVLAGLDCDQEDSPSVASKTSKDTSCPNSSCRSEPSPSQQQSPRHKSPTQEHQNKFKVITARPLPQPPVESVTVERKRRSKKGNDITSADATAASTLVTSSNDGFVPPPQDRLLSARERRRLRQSQESHSDVGAFRRASYDVTSTKPEHCKVGVTRSASYSITETNNKNKLMEQKSDEDECSSSTSSTERSEGDCRERKTESRDMQDLVQMMTQTLRMGIKDGGHEVDKGAFDSTTLPEFKLNRKYRDTLVLHGKARGEAEDLPLSKIPKGSTSGPAKIRRAIEQLRTDVVKGLGVKLLDQVLEILEEEEDETKRELCLRDHMGDEKYQAYAVMVRQLKFFEDMAFKA
uniref:Serine/threonine-protein kinase Nek4 n=1 Tax=Oryzias latipes TaxID=8090 RepID=A0A3P9KYA2_ORYLA